MISGKMETRIQQLLDGELPEAECRETLGQLETSEELRRAYCEHARILCELDGLRRERLALAAPALRRIRTKRRWRVGITAMAASIVVALPAIYLLGRAAPKGTTLAAAGGARYNVSPAPEMVGGESVLRDGSDLWLEQGVVELRFATGARSVVRGPAGLTVVNGGKVRLDHGSGWFHVPPGAEGFQVTTPRAEITDLGTEFGVIAGSDSADSMHTLKGSIQVRNRAGEEETATLRAGAAVSAMPGGKLKDAPFRPELFFTGLPASLPWLGWSFSGNSPSVWRAGGSMPEASRVTSQVHPATGGIESTPGPFGTALHSPGGRAWTTDWPGIGGNAPRTLAFWLRLPPRGDYIHPIVGWGHRYGDYDAQLSSFFAYVQTVNGVTAAGVSLGGYWILGNSRIDDDRWHHLAIVATGNTLPDGRPDLRIHVDGREETVTPSWSSGCRFSEKEPLLMATETADADSRPLSAFSQLYPGEPAGHGFPASIDELIVVEGALDAADIEALFKENQRPGETRVTR